MTSIPSSSCDNPPDRLSETKRKEANISLLPDEDFNFDHDDKHPGTIPCAVDREWISPRQGNKRARHTFVSPTSHAAIGPSDGFPPPVECSHIHHPVDNTVPSSPPRLVTQQPSCFDGDVNNQIDQAASPTRRHLVIHRHSSEDEDDEAAPPATPPLPSPHFFQADQTSASDSHHHHPTTSAPISYFSPSSSPDPIVGPSPNRPVARTPSARSGSGHAGGMGPRGSRWRGRRDGNDGRVDRREDKEVQSRRRLKRRWSDGEVGNGMERREEVVWWKAGEQERQEI